LLDRRLSLAQILKDLRPFPTDYSSIVLYIFSPSIADIIFLFLITSVVADYSMYRVDGVIPYFVEGRCVLAIIKSILY
jgi:hypothetical protein